MLSELQRVKIDDSFDKQAMTSLKSEAIDFRAASELFADLKKSTINDLQSWLYLPHIKAKRYQR